MSLKTFKDHADNDFKYIEEFIDGLKKYPNKGVIEAQQVAEKYLKAILDEVGGKVIKSHDLVKLYRVINIDLGLQEEELSWLARFYFNDRYPGKEDDEVITVNDVEQSIEIAKAVRTAYYEYKWKSDEKSGELIDSSTVPPALSELLAKASIS